MSIPVIEPQVNLISLVFLLAAGQGCFLVLALTSLKGRNRRANWLLAIFTLIFSVTLVDGFFEYTRLFFNYPHLAGIVWPTNFLYGPVIFLYTREMVSQQIVKYSWKQLLHFLPFLIAFILVIPFFTLGADVKQLVMYGDVESLLVQQLDSSNYQLFWVFIGIVTLVFGSAIQIGVYIVLAILLLRRHVRNIKDQFSSVEKIDLVWLRNLLGCFSILWLLFLFGEFFAEGLGVDQETVLVLHLMIALLIFAIGYMGIKQPKIFFSESNSNSVKVDGATNEATVADITTGNQHCSVHSEKYAKSSLTKSQAQTLVVKLRTVMSEKKPYLNNTLSLDTLASEIDTAPHHLSQVINDQLNVNFFDFVNRYRINEAKQQIQNTQGRLNVLAIAYDSGFSSKSAFYSAFKKYTDLTPTQYRQQGSMESD